MKTYTFKLELSGKGNSPEEAWDNAVEAFNQEAGCCPESWTDDDDDQDEDQDDDPMED